MRLKTILIVLLLIHLNTDFTDVQWVVAFGDNRIDPTVYGVCTSATAVLASTRGACLTYDVTEVP